MAGIIDSVDRRTQLAGHNRMELLLFRLGGKQRYGINVFKVREVIPAPELQRVPHAHHVARGIAHIRGQTIPVIDLSYAVNGTPIHKEDGNYILITEYNRQVQGFLVAGVERIVNMNWEDVLPPPSSSSGGTYLTAIARHEGQMVQIIDVEKVLSELRSAGGADAMTTEGGGVDALQGAEDFNLLVVDDSSVARNQILRTLKDLGPQTASASNGREALKMLENWKLEEPERLRSLLMVISDIEMPVMDGYTLTRRIREDPELEGLHVLLHTSLSGVFNSEMVRRVGADDFLAKFHAGELGERVQAQLNRRLGND